MPGTSIMPTFKNAFIPDSLVLSTSLTPDNQAASIVVENLKVTLNAAEKPNSPGKLNVGRGLSDHQLVAACLSNIFVQLRGDEQTVQVKIDIRGYVDAEAGARGVLVTRLAGKTFTDELVGDENNGLYTFSHTVSVSPANGLSITLLLLVDRDIVDGALPFAAAGVETIDLAFEAEANP
jgi:hypothetical protein